MSTAPRDAGFEALLGFVKSSRGFDFTGYKRPSLQRRVDRRLEARKVGSYDEYRALLEQEPDEFVALFDSVLINVTAFFRDEFAWEYLREEVVPRLLEPGRAETIRVWSTGCATGEEAFSIAILLAEAMGEEEYKQRVKIYATDLDDEALNIGRHALYTTKQIQPVPPDLREKYFRHSSGRYVFRTDLRRTVIFGRHDLVSDPPISRVDLLVSRNTLMYFTTETQEKILAGFYFALRDDGFLFLGKSEALTTRRNWFAAIDLKRRVFAKVPRQEPRVRVVPTPDGPVLREKQPAEGADERVREAGLDAVPVAYLVVDREGNLVLANLHARAQFGITQRDVGRPIQDHDISFRPVELRSRIEKAYEERHGNTLRDVEWRPGGEARYLDVQVAPLVGPTGETIGCGITFQDVTRYRRLQGALDDSKREAETAYEELQSTFEELETTNEELQATNEELETTNEELQATNEELETTNEELQSTNEELETMNDEIHQRGLELNSANAFLEAVLTSLDAAVIVLDGELEITAWNEGARRLWGLNPPEVLGRHLLNLDIGLATEDLRAPIRTLLADGSSPSTLELPATTRGGHAVRLHITLTPLHNDGSAPGVIVMMQADET